ncbi:MAG: hypothetical protein KDC38_09770 [Planctomycetes bacterium]|nr:hypothetical protein [Planctomycetota bacterium]
MVGPAAARFRACFQALEDCAFPASRLIRIVDDWIRGAEIGSRDRAWIDERSGYVRLRREAPLGVEPDLQFDDSLITEPGTVPMHELEAICARSFVELLRGERGTIQRCVHCDRLFPVDSTPPDSEGICSESCPGRRLART